VNTERGQMFRVINTNPDWQNLSYDEHYTVGSNNRQTWTVEPDYCDAPACDGAATGLVLVSADGRNTLNLREGQTICASDINFEDAFVRVNTEGP